MSLEKYETLYDQKVIHDEEAKEDVFFNVYTEIRFLNADITESKQKGYMYADGKRLEGKELKKELKKMEERFAFLLKLMGSANKYLKDESLKKSLSEAK